MTYRIPLTALLCLAFLPTSLDAQESDREETFEARITAVNDILCDDATDGCRMWTLNGLTGVMEGEEFTISTEPDDGIGVTTPAFEQGDRVIVQTQIINGERMFFMTDVVRRPILLLLTALFVVAVWLFGGIAAMRSFAGMAASLGVLFFLIIPGILAGYPPLLLTLACSVLIMILTFLLGHGWNSKTGAAFMGTCVSLLLTTFLATVFGSLARLSGRADDNMSYLLSDVPNLDARGILLAAVIIGTLAVLDDVTIAQSSAVFELRGANPRWNRKQIYHSACRIGGDHIAAAINTLILAYASTALPLLLLYMNIEGHESIWTFLNREPIATEIVRTLIGSIGLLAAVPLTTWIASWWAIRTDPNTLPSEASHHH
jgi:uncharacterized membrane protein